MLRLDSHVDTMHQIYKPENKFTNLQDTRFDLQVDIPKLEESGVNAVFMALFIKQSRGKTYQDTYQEVLNQHLLFLDVIDANPQLVLNMSPSDIEYTISEPNRYSVSLGLENAYSIGHDLSVLQIYHSLGVRYVTLCHNKTNQICDSATDNPAHYGLSDFGCQVIRKMNQLGMMIDISHLSDLSVNSVLNNTELPVIASHSGSRNICNNPRNLSDELLEKIARNGGVVQTTLLPKCVGGDYIRYYVDHIEYIRDLIGIDYVGIGSDFDGGGGIADCQHIGEMANITDELIHRGFNQSEIDKVWGGNFMRVYRANYC